MGPMGPRAAGHRANRVRLFGIRVRSRAVREDFADFGRDLCGVFRSITVTYPGAFRESERICYAEGRRPRRGIPKREVATRTGTDRRAVDLARRLGGRKRFAI